MRKPTISAVTVASAVLLAGCSIEEPTTAPIKADAKPADNSPSPEESGPLSLTGTAKLGDTATVTLSRIERGTSGAYAAPASTPFVKFTTTVKNLGKKAIDPSDIMMACTYGSQGKTAELVFDSENGVGDMPTVKVLPGKSTTFTQGCELPKDETELQIQADHVWDGETVIFGGKVK